MKRTTKLYLIYPTLTIVIASIIIYTIFNIIAPGISSSGKVPFGFQSVVNGKVTSGSGFMPAGKLQRVISDTEIQCEPDPEFPDCWGWEYKYKNDNGDAVADAIVKMQVGDLKCTAMKEGYCVGKAVIPYKFEGTNFYVYQDLGSFDNVWETANCRKEACDGQSLPAQGEFLLANPGQEYNHCPVFLAHDYDYQTAGDGSTAYAWTAYMIGWEGNKDCWDVKSVNCVDNSDCLDGQMCKNDGDWKTWACIEIPKNTYYHYDSDKNSCSTVISASPGANDYETIEECNSQIKPNYILYIAIGVIAIGLIIFIVSLLRVLRRRKHA